MFTFALPWLFILLPLPWLVYKLLKRADIQDSAALKVPFFALCQSLLAQAKGSSDMLGKRKYLAYLIWILLLASAAAPQWLGEAIELPRSGRDIMLAVDISVSMQITDMKLKRQAVDRLTIVKDAASRFVDKRVGDRLGLILFGSKAYLQTPLTFDQKTIQAMLDDASIGLAGRQTAIGDAVGLAVKHLLKTDDDSRVLVLLTDGVSNTGVLEPIQAAKLAAEHDIKIYTIGLGANRMLVDGFLGQRAVNPSADLDEGTLQKISKLTQGKFFRATDVKSLNSVYRSIDKLEPITRDNTVIRPIMPLYYWPLALAFILSVYLALTKLNLKQYFMRESKV